MVEGEEKLGPSMSALAVLSCRPNSHPFQERHISLHEASKIGRSVARARPAASNGIFDCKVLSRNHAMLWFDAGKFYLQDTKSSNGTFVNNQRLCKGGEESPARELFSGDLIQFGVEVMENNRRGEKITHGCIVATIALYLPDGREAKPTPYLGGENQPGLSLQTQDLYQLAQYLQEALHREKMLEQKLLTLQELVHNTQEASVSGWQALIDEDKLLSRLEMLENQLHIYSKNHSEDTLRQELVALQEDKNKYETTSKESLRRVLQEKLEAVTKLSDLEQSLGNMKDECSHLKLMCEGSQDELSCLAQKYQDQLKEVAEFQDKLQEAEQLHALEIEKSDQEKSDISVKLEEMMKQENSLSAQIESLEADNDFTKEQLAAMKAKLETVKEPNEDDLKLSELELNGSTTEEIDIIPLGPPKEDDVPENLEVKLKELQKLIEVYKGKMEISDQNLEESNQKIETLQKNLDTAVASSEAYLLQITQLEDKVKLSDYHMNQMVESALDNLKLQLSESAKQSSSSNDLIEAMKDHIHLMEQELTFQTPINSVQNSTDSLGDSGLHDSTTGPSSSPPPLSTSSSRSSVTLVGSPSDDLHNTTLVNGSNMGMNHEDQVDAPKMLPQSPPSPDSSSSSLSSTSAPSEMPHSPPHVSSNSSGVPNLDDDEDLKALLIEARQAQQRAEQELRKYKEQVTDSETKLKMTSEEVNSLRSQLAEANMETKEKYDVITDLQDQVHKAESFTQDVKQQILDLREHLEVEKVKNKTALEELEEAKLQLTTSQQSAKQSHNEAEHLRDKLRHLQDELESERNRRESPRHGTSSDRLSAKSKEYQALKEECTNLRKRIQAIEAEMKMSRKENLHLSSEYNKLQESYKQLESLKSKLETSEVSWRVNLTDAQKDACNIQKEVKPGPSLSTLSSDSALPSSISSSPSRGDRPPSQAASRNSTSPPPASRASSPPQSHHPSSPDASLRLAARSSSPSSSSARQPTRGGHLSASGSASQSNLAAQQSPEETPSLASVVYFQLDETSAELDTLRAMCEEKSSQIGSLQKQVNDLSTDFHTLQAKSRMVSLVSSIPLLLLLFAILLAIYPTLEALTSGFS